MQAIEVVDFKIPYHQKFGNHVNFNPSIAHYKDDLFLISFHTFRRNEGHPLKHIVKGSIYDPYHMFYTGHWWDHGDGVWGTAFALARINDRQIEYIKTMGYNDYGTDMRLLNTGNGVFIGTMTMSSEPEDKGYDRILYELDAPIGSSVSISMLEIEIIDIDNTYMLEDADQCGNVICENLQDAEKNWSTFIYNKKLYISNFLVPKHIVFVPRDDTCSVKKSDKTTYFQQLEEYYEKTILVSLSTPALAYGTMMLGCGHLKLSMNDLPRNSSAYQFLKKATIPPHPTKTFYMMFLYTFNPKTYNIVDISPAFFPPNVEHGIVFPCGLEYYQNEYIISYGEGDAEMKFLFMSKESIKDLLHAENYYDDEYEFIYL